MPCVKIRNFEMKCCIKHAKVHFFNVLNAAFKVETNKKNVIKTRNSKKKSLNFKTNCKIFYLSKLLKFFHFFTCLMWTPEKKESQGAF